MHVATPAARVMMVTVQLGVRAEAHLGPAAVFSFARCLLRISAFELVHRRRLSAGTWTLRRHLVSRHDLVGASGGPAFTGLLVTH